ncbi:killer toxin subunits alpha/beta [Plectosphaerella plurivora]|uniref:chitinase n=1 Tax=Plectosphaerella plurivora TaxID=936078 RepID=A0A9P9ABX0_9PEZI|nr:killer toxin subunits alpha/beta [Plectosphaerella plurivora]
MRPLHTAASSLLLLLPLLEGALAQQLGGPASLESKIVHSRSCPRACDKVGRDLEEWSHLSDLDSLAICPEPVVLAFNLYTPLVNGKAPVNIRACTVGDASTEDNFLAEAEYVSPDAKGETNMGPSLRRRAASNDTGTEVPKGIICGVDAPRKTTITAGLSSWDGGARNMAAEVNDRARLDAVEAIGKLSAHVARQADRTCDKLITLAYVRGTIVGVYAGSLIDNTKTTVALLETLAEEMNASSSAGRKAIEVCGTDRSSSATFGGVADATGDFATVQKILRTWSDGACVGDALDADSARDLANTDIWTYEVDAAVLEEPTTSRRDLGGHRNRLHKRADCRSIRVEHNDDCTKLAARCGLGGRAFESFNSATKDLCSTLKPGQPVCCSSGTLPDVKPKPNSDGSCAVYAVQADEGCDAVAVRHGLVAKDLEDLNKKTWGWDGCDAGLGLEQRICVSSGEPPMPATYPDAACGPTKPGSKRPTDGTALVDMNPCPLKVCCNVWGNCGTTADFCTISKTNTNNPGTSQPGANGCQSSCGTKIVNNGQAPAQFRKIAYFEAWNFNRPCLNMNVLDVAGRGFTHVHFAFAEISSSMQVVIPADQKKQWDQFVKATNFPKKVLAFGGWAFSNEGPNSGLLRQAVSPSNRAAFADHVVKFAQDNKLDGLDFDWEYPGATDIDGSIPGQEEDGENYYEFLKLVKSKLPSSMSLSIAAPASYWYLRGFPIEKMAKVLDYIVYMTYDFHGQWDVGSKWAMEGCAGGNCLRSHVNATITHGSLVMVTKAGVPTHQIVVGVSSYGRSFKMSDAACRGELCTFLGARNQSPAKPGRCTGVGGYISNFEIEEIITKGGAIKSWWDQTTDTDYLVYSQTEWVAYMTETTKARRTDQYKALNLGGTSDWAVDLQGEGKLGEDGGGGGGGDDDDDDDGPDSDFVPDPEAEKPLEACTYEPKNMDQIQNLDFQNRIRPHCVARYLLPILNQMLIDVKKLFDEISDSDYDKFFNLYAEHMYLNSGEAMWSLMMKEGDKYFNCDVYGKFPCCPGCSIRGPNCPNVCINDCQIRGSNHPGWEQRRRTMPCPPDMSMRGGIESDRYHMESIWWTYKSDEKKKEFHSEIEANVGAAEKFIEYPGTRPHYKQSLAKDMCYGSRPPPDGQLPGYDELGVGCQAEHWWHKDAPRISSSFKQSDVFNPKTEIKNTLDKITVFPVLAEFELSQLANEYEHNADELVDALILPVFMMYAGLEHMENVIEMGKKIEEANKIALITQLLSAVLLVIGGFGGVAAGAANAGLRALGRALVGLAEAGNAGLGIYTAVGDPTTTPLLIFGLIMSGVNLRDASKVASAAKLKQGLNSADFVSISPSAGRMASIASSAASKRPITNVRYC